MSDIEKKISAALSADEIASSALSQLVGEVEAAIAQDDADTVKARETALDPAKRPVGQTES